jgi:hypothetical protein
MLLNVEKFSMNGRCNSTHEIYLKIEQRETVAKLGDSESTRLTWSTTLVHKYIHQFE